VITGYIDGPVTIGTSSLSSFAYPSAVLLKTDLSGSPQWAENFRNTVSYGFSQGQYLAIDDNDNIYASGIFIDSIYFNSPVVSLYGWNRPYYLAKFTSSGAALWADAFADDNYSGYVSYIRCDNSGNPFLFGYADYQSVIGPSTIPGAGSFFAKINTGGTIEYAVQQKYETNQSLFDASDMLYQVSICKTNDLCLNKTDVNGNLSWENKTTSGCGNTSTWYDVAVDPNGFCFLHGDINGKITYDGTTVDGTGTYLARLSGDKKLKWINIFSGKPGTLGSMAVTSDPNGNSYAFGWYGDTLTIGQTVLVNPNSSTNGTAFYLAKFNDMGSLQWVKSLNATNQIFEVGGIAADASGNVVVASSFNDNLVIGSTTLVSNGGYDFFIAKFSPDGTPLFAKSFGGTSTDYARSLAVDPQNNILVTGCFTNTVNFGGTSLTSLGGRDVFIAKYDPNGNSVWAKQASGASSEQGFAVTTDNSGNVFVSGLTYSSSMTFGTIVVDYISSNNMFLAKYSASGTPLWAHGIMSPTYLWPAYQMGCDEEGSCYVGGQYLDTLIFHDGTKLIGENYGNYLAKFTTYGAYEWSKNLVTNENFTDLFSIAVYNKNSILVGGRIYNGKMVFDATTIASAGSSAFLALVGNNLPNGINPLPDETDRLVIYPNPASHYVYVNIDHPAIETIECTILDQNGKLVFKTQVYGTSQIRVDLPDLPVGLYYLSLHTGTKASTWKLIINP
jgi:hypothetical protein